MEKLQFRHIPKFPRAHYRVNTPWDYLETNVQRHVEEYGLNLNPDFQREHVWTEKQQRAYVEYALQGGEVGKVLTFNHPGWMGDWKGPYEILDGKQRLEAVRKFLRNDLKVFGRYFEDFQGHMGSECDFIWQVCCLKTRAEILQLYLNINAGGTPHSKKELDRVRKLLDEASVL